MVGKALVQLSELAANQLADRDKISETRLKSYQAIGVANELDLLFIYPRRYIDRSKQLGISEVRAELQKLEEAEKHRVADVAARIKSLSVELENPDLSESRRASVLAEREAYQKVDEYAKPKMEALVFAHASKSTARRTRTGKVLVEVLMEDDTEHAMTLSFFNQMWRKDQLSEGVEAFCFGKVELDRKFVRMTNPMVDLSGNRSGRIVPLYPQSPTKKLYTWDIERDVQALTKDIGEIADSVPAAELKRLELVGRNVAFAQIHQPDSFAARADARERLAFDELLRVQLVLLQRRREMAALENGIAHKIGGELVGKFTKQLPFELTSAQKRALADIQADLSQKQPMHRLLQGDVGSGKTIVALLALLTAVDGGSQGAIMAPTEVLAEQHALSIRTLINGLTIADSGDLFGERPVRVELLTGKLAAADRKRLNADLAAGHIDIAIGTHALLSEGTDFANLGVVVIDEQHRFGVDQRAVLKGKGAEPDVLVMTATPIPRTAALAIYGDLDLSILDELPPGRTPIKTKWAQDDAQVKKTWDWLTKEIKKGRQAYVVCPLIEPSKAKSSSSETETGDLLFADNSGAPLPSVTETLEELREGPLKGLRIEALHGRMKSDEKQYVMEQFRAAKIDVLISTTVIEVGVDVPNSTVMVIMGADRFGISQLHQLRGRVGRGSEQSWCFLVTNSFTTPDAETRIKALVASTDGFELATVDLELRGEGALFGTRQTGMHDLRLASLARDLPLIESAREVADHLLDAAANGDKQAALAVSAERAVLERSVETVERVFDS